MTEFGTERRVVLVTGPAGAGRASAIRALEDIGFEAIDNMPLRFMEPLLETPPTDRPLALGIDPRTRDFSTDSVTQTMDYLASLPDVQPELLYMDCAPDVLLQRFSETRRRHPSAVENRVDAGIELEIESLARLMDLADFKIDTTAMNVHELRAEIEGLFAPAGKGLLAVSLQSFSYKRGLPRGVDMVFDCRFLRNPYWDPSMRHLDGRDPQVRHYVAQDPRYAEFESKVRELLLFLLPAQIQEGKSHFSVGFGCTGGQHRSVTLAEEMAASLASADWKVSVRHIEMTRRTNMTRAKS